MMGHRVIPVLVSAETAWLQWQACGSDRMVAFQCWPSSCSNMMAHLVKRMREEKIYKR